MPRLITDLATSLDARSVERIRARIEGLGQDGVPPEILHRIGVLLGSTADPDTAARHLDQFWRENPNAFLRIGGQVPTLRYLIAIFSYSSFLSEAVLKKSAMARTTGPRRGICIGC